MSHPRVELRNVCFSMAIGLETLVQGGHGLTSPTFDRLGRLLVASSASGEVHQVVTEGASSTLQTIFNTGGSPSSLCVDVEGAVFVCDVAHQAVFRHGDDELSEFVKEYEAKPFKGPSAMLLDGAGNMFFTDSGPLGETTLQSPKGSVFLISADGQLLQPLLLEALADPCALALGLDERVIFVAEKMQNRLLRLVQRPAGVYHCSVFHQFSGFLGPSGIARDPQASARLLAPSALPRRAERPRPPARPLARRPGYLPTPAYHLPASHLPTARSILLRTHPTLPTLAHPCQPVVAGQSVRDAVRLRLRGCDEAGLHLQDLARGPAA